MITRLQEWRKWYMEKQLANRKSNLTMKPQNEKYDNKQAFWSSCITVRFWNSLAGSVGSETTAAGWRRHTGTAAAQGSWRWWPPEGSTASDETQGSDVLWEMYLFHQFGLLESVRFIASLVSHTSYLPWCFGHNKKQSKKKEKEKNYCSKKPQIINRFLWR